MSRSTWQCAYCLKRATEGARSLAGARRFASKADPQLSREGRRNGGDGQSTPVLSFQQSSASIPKFQQQQTPKKGKEAEGSGSTVGSLYPNSKAWKTAGKGLPTLFSHKPKQMPPPRKPPRKPLPMLADVIVDMSDERTRPERMKLLGAEQLIEVIRDQAQKGHVHTTIVACKQLREVIKADDSATPPTGIDRALYNSLLSLFAKHGLAEDAAAVIADMKAFPRDATRNDRESMQPGIKELDVALEAAAVSKNEGIMVLLLDEIAQLSVDAKATPLQEQQEMTVLIDPAYSRNWTPSTYGSLIKLCHTSRNIEFALALVGSIQRRIRPPDTPLSSDSGESHTQGDTFSYWIAPNARPLLVKLGLEAREPGLALDFALLLEGDGRGKLAASTWLDLLRGSADEHYAPGVVEAWDRLRDTHQTTQEPDEGLVLRILSCCGRAGEPRVALQAVKRLEQSRYFAQSNRHLQEWHLTPIFEAYCAAREWGPAVRHLGFMRRRGVQLQRHHWIQFGTEIQRSGGLEQAAFHLEKAGKDTSALGGLDIVAFNGLLHASSLARDVDRAVTLFQNASKLYALRMDDKATEKAPAALEPNLDSFNILFSALIHTKDNLTGRTFVQLMNRRGVAADRSTYEKLIALELSANDFRKAFEYLEEAKLRNHVPTQQIYELLIYRCYEERDERWRLLLDEMAQVGHKRPSERLLRRVKMDQAPQFASMKSRARVFEM